MLLVDKDTFEPEVLETEEIVLVDYFGETCEPCKALMPHIEAMEEKYGQKVKFCKMDTGKARRLAIKQKVLGLPTISMYKNGEKIDELVKDDATPETIEAMIQKYI